MIITSGFRNDRVNKLVGGSDTSEHKKGMAADFIINGMTVQAVIEVYVIRLYLLQKNEL